MSIEAGFDGKIPRIPRGRHVHYVPNHRSFGMFIKSDQMRDVTEKVARDIAGVAKALSPASNRPGIHMRDQFEVNRNAGVIKVGRNIRVKVVVFNSNRAAAPNEFGTSRNKRHRMLGRAGAAFGDFKPEGGPT